MQTAREQLEQDYLKTGEDFTANTRMMDSTCHMTLTSVNQGITTTGVLVGDFVAKAGQEMQFFGYDRSGQIPGSNVAALADDTNLVTARRTNSQEDIALEGFSLVLRSIQVEYAAGDGPVTTDSDSAQAYTLGASSVVFDPGAINLPSVLQGFVNNEDALFAALAPHMFVRMRFDKRDEEIGTADLFPCASAKSLMRASGVPDPSVRLRVPEGYVWRQQGTDSNLLVIARLARAVTIPYAAVQPVGQSAKKYVKTVRLHWKLRAHGIAFGYQSKN